MNKILTDYNNLFSSKFLTLIVLYFFTYSNIFCQDLKVDFGLKIGLYQGKYVPDKKNIDYNFKTGFYAGGFLNLKVDEKISFQPELLFELKGSEVQVNNIQLTDFDGNIIPFTDTFNFEYNIHELTISVPLIFRLYLFKKFYFESGIQFGFIFDRNLASSQSFLDGNNSNFIVTNGDRFDFGAPLGLGFYIFKRVSLSVRSFSTLYKRDDDIKSFGFNFGIEYKF